MKKINITLFTFLILLSSINFNSYADIKKNNSKSYMSSSTFKKINFNSYAPEDYDKNFQPGDVALIPFQDSVKVVLIKEKLDSTYVVYPKQFTFKDAERMSSINQFKFNSVYPYFDLKDFNEKTYKYKKFILPHLKSYAKKFNIKDEQVTYFPDNNYYSISSVEDYNEQLKNLGELNGLLNRMNLPDNNYMNYTVNPVIWKEISSNAKEYMDLLLSNPDPSFQDLIKNYVKEIQDAKSKVDNYNGSNFMFTGSSEWAFRSVSENVRNHFYSQNKGFKRQVELSKLSSNNFDPFKSINDELKLLSESIDKNLYKLKSNNEYFKFRDNDSEKVMKSYLKDIKSLKILKIGMRDNNWTIVKNSFGVPLYKYRYGTMVIDNPKDDIKYCKTLYFNLQKDYASGAYGVTKVSSYHEELLHCSN